MRVSPVVVLLGARQTGKTTLVRTLPVLAERPYLTLDDFDLRTQAFTNPEEVVARAPRLILDEVQRASDLLLAVKRSVDEDPERTPGRFVLTGSANLLLMKSVSESLAGRASYVNLWPFTRRERLGHGDTGPWSELLTTDFSKWPAILDAHRATKEPWQAAARLGGLPVPSYRLSDDDARGEWFSGYIQTYIERDLQTIRAVEDLAEFRRFMRAASLRIGGMLNQAELARDVGISQPQAHRYLNLLEVTFQVIRLPAFSLHRAKRLIKSPKLYWGDTGLALHVAGEHEARGAHLENLVLMDLIVWRDIQPRRPQILYWRTATGQEVDFVIETPKRLLPIEVKASARVSPPDAAGLEAFLQEYPDLSVGGVLLYGGSETYPLTRRVIAVPWWRAC